MRLLTSAAFSLFTTIIIFFSLAEVVRSISSDDPLPNCNQTFSCGPLTGISYPFTGGLRPSYCGPPDFHLTCVNDSTTVLTTDSLSYRVILLDQTNHSLTLSRSDLFNTTCTDEFSNTTLNSTIFTFSSNNEILTLFYGCNDSVMTFRPQNLFSCDINGLFSNAYYLIGPVPNDPILQIVQCHVSVTVPILESWVSDLGANRSLLKEVLMDGFNVGYINLYGNDCEKCRDSGGQCGFDAELGKPLCICNDRICPGGSNQTPMSIGLAIAGAAIAGIVLGCWFLVVIQRRKRKAAAAAAAESAAQMESKDLSTPLPSSKGITTTTNLSRSVPSFPSSHTKSDLEKGSTYFGVQVFSYEELQEATDDFDPSKELGDGGFGTVYYGILQDGRVVAVKRLYDNNIKRAEQFMNEVEILARLRHKNLVTLFGCTSRRSRELLLVYEYIPNGTVADHLHGGRSSNSGLLTLTTRLSIAIETAGALAYLHASDIIHRDVKTNNILLDNNFCVKVADFGLSRLFPNDVTHVSTAPQGTPGYVDPEYYQCYQLTDKSDVYSFGVVLIELISSLPAVDTNRHRQDINLANMAVSKIQNHTINELVDPMLGFEKNYKVRRMTTSVAELAFRCLQQERDMRPTMEEVLKCLKKIENEDYGLEKAEVVDIREDDVEPLRHIPPPLSPDSVATDKWDLKMIRTI